MNLRQLQYFIAIAELEHYTRAAEKLYVSQSNLSHSIKELEEELNVQLFMRKGRNVKLTKYGELFLPYASKALELLDNGVQCLNDYVNPNTGSIVLSGFPSLSEFIPDVIVRYLSETNRVGVHIQFNQSADFTTLKKQLMDGDIDLAFATVIDEPEIRGTLIGEHELVFVTSEHSAFAGLDEMDLRLLDGKPFIAFDNNCELRSFTDRYFRELGIRTKIKLQTANDTLMYGMVAAGQGDAIMPYPIGGAPYNLKIKKIKNDIPTRKIFLQWNKDRYMPPAAVYLRDFIVRQGLIFNEFMERKKHEILP